MVIVPPPLSVPPVLLEARDLRVEFGTTVALRDVSLTLRAGELLGLIGPNGAGKTTLLRACCGLQPVQRGTVSVHGMPVAEGQIDYRRRIGFTPDTPAAYEQLTVRDYLAFVGMGYGLDAVEVQERSEFWLERLWLSDKTKQKVKGLSRGMRQRLGIARCLLPNPTVILLDEPAAGLDPAGRVQFRELLIDLKNQSKALIISSHILSDMGEYCTHIGIMSRGQMVRYGTVDQVANSAHADGRCRYILSLALPSGDLEQTLAAISGVSDISVSGNRAMLTYDRAPMAAAELLKRLVQAGVPVAGFAPQAAGLEEAYLRQGIAQVD
jgi:ABC-2 type transport system ATP-binding protein